MHPHRRRRMFHQYFMPIMVSLVAVLIVGALLVFQNQIQESRQAKTTLSQAIVDASLVSNLGEAELESLLARSSSDQLTRLALELADESDQQLAVRLDRMKMRVAILDRILELDPDEQVRNFAISSKLNTLMDREYVAVKNELDDFVLPTQLREFAGRHAQSENVSIANLAAAAVAVAAISEFLAADAAQRRSELAKPAMEEFQNAASNTVNDVSVAKRLEKWLKLIQVSSDAGQSQVFVDAFVNGYRGSTNDIITGMATRIRKTLSSSELDLIDVMDSGPTNRQDIVNQLVSQVDAAVNQDDVSESSRLHILSRAEDLLRRGWKTEAESIRRVLDRFPEDETADELTRELARFDQRLKLFDEPFDISGFTDQHSQPAQFKTAAAKFKILFFGSAANDVQPMVKFNQLLNILRSELLNSSVEIAVVYLHRNDDLEGLAGMKTFAAQSGRWQVWFLTTRSPAGEAFLAKTPFDTTPFVIVLGRDNHVISLDPPIIGIKEVVQLE